MNVVVVESPAKAKTINKYLGSDYKVLASYGHVRDLPAKDGSVRPVEDFAMAWEVDGRGVTNLAAIAQAPQRPPRAPPGSSSPPAPTATARPSPGTCLRCCRRSGR